MESSGTYEVVSLGGNVVLYEFGKAFKVGMCSKKEQGTLRGQE